MKESVDQRTWILSEKAVISAEFSVSPMMWQLFLLLYFQYFHKYMIYYKVLYNKQKKIRRKRNGRRGKCNENIVSKRTE